MTVLKIGPVCFQSLACGGARHLPRPQGGCGKLVARDMWEVI